MPTFFSTSSNFTFTSLSWGFLKSAVAYCFHPPIQYMDENWLKNVKQLKAFVVKKWLKYLTKVAHLLER